MPTFSRGDVVLVLFPNSDLRTAKTRPALIVQADNLDTDLPQVVVAMLTSKTFRANHPSRVLVKMDSEMGINSGLLSNISFAFLLFMRSFWHFLNKTPLYVAVKIFQNNYIRGLGKIGETNVSNSVVMTDNLATIAGFGVSQVIGKLPMKAIDEALKHTLGL